MKQFLETLNHFKQRIDWSLVFGLGFFLFIVILLAQSFVAVSNWMASDKNSQIKQVTVLGLPEHTSEQQILAAIRKADLSSFFELDVNEVQKQVVELPWVASASIRKQWPDTLKVYVVEHVPVAIWNDDQLLNNYGEAFQAPKSSIKESLPSLFGPEGSEQEAWQTFQQFHELFYINNFKLISLALSERFSWQLWLDNGIKLNLGREEKAQRVQRFIDLYPYMLKRKDAEVDVVDLRYDTGLAVSWKPLSSQQLQQQKSKA